jgi:hypothetical protein
VATLALAQLDGTSAREAGLARMPIVDRHMSVSAQLRQRELFRLAQCIIPEIGHLVPL